MFTQAAGNHLWQSTVCVAVAWLLALALRRNRAAVRYGVWMAASVKFLIPFAWLAGWGARFDWRAPQAVATVRIPVAVSEIGQPFQTFEPATVAAAPAAHMWPVVLLSIWLCGIAVGVMFWAREHRRMRGTLRGAKVLDLNLPIPVMAAQGRMEPGVFGIWKPVLLLPEGIAERLTPEQLEAILAHELRHVHRRDNLTAALHMLVETIFWFHPAVWWIRARLVEERERACDEGVLRLGSEPQVYAESILKVCEFYLSAPVCAAGVTGGELKKRIEGIMENRFGLRMGIGKRALLALAGFAAVALPLALGVLHAAQTAKRDYRFEVASIRPGDPSGRMSGPPAPFSPGRFSSESTTIVGLAMRAFDIKQMSQIEYQPWMASGHFNVDATIPKGAAAADLPIMIQHLLEDRFGLVFHRETRRMAGYELVAAKSGPKLAKSSAPPSGEPPRNCGDIEMKNGVPQLAKDAGSCQLLTLTTAIWRGRNKTMKSLAEDLANNLGMPVVDATGMEGEYDYTLTFTPEARQASGNMVVFGPPGAAPTQEPRQDEFPTNPLLRDALQEQLGLKLQPVKDVPAEVVVLDSARKQPTEN